MATFKATEEVGRSDFRKICLFTFILEGRRLPDNLGQTLFTTLANYNPWYEIWWFCLQLGYRVSFGFTWSR